MKYYIIRRLIFFARLTNVEPDWQKVGDFLQKYCIKVEKIK